MYNRYHNARATKGYINTVIHGKLDLKVSCSRPKWGQNVYKFQRRSTGGYIAFIVGLVCAASMTATELMSRKFFQVLPWLVIFTLWIDTGVVKLPYKERLVSILLVLSQTSIFLKDESLSRTRDTYEVWTRSILMNIHSIRIESLNWIENHQMELNNEHLRVRIIMERYILNRYKYFIPDCAS